MTTETKAPTAESMTKDYERAMRGVPMSMRDEVRKLLKPMFDAAPLGAQVPGLRVQLEDFGRRLAAEREASAAFQSEVSALQARVAELDARVVRVRAGWDGATDRTTEVSADRDALRAQVERTRTYLEAEHANHKADAEKAGPRGNVVHLLKAQVVSNAMRALSTPPAEEKPDGAVFAGENCNRCADGRHGSCEGDGCVCAIQGHGRPASKVVERISVSVVKLGRCATGNTCVCGECPDSEED